MAPFRQAVLSEVVAVSTEQWTRPPDMGAYG